MQAWNVAENGIAQFSVSLKKNRKKVSNAAAEMFSEATSLTKDVSQHASNVLVTVKELMGRVKDGEFNTSKGISFLNVKSQMLLSYLSNLTFLILKKASGKQIENDPSVERLVELRTVLEKIKPIDEKLKYQVQKVLATATTGNADSEDPLRFRANPSNLINQLEEQESEPSDAEEKKPAPRNSNVYVPPKISATYYEGDETALSKQQKRLELVKKRALSSSVLQELRSEYDAGPEEIKEVVDLHKQKFNDDMKERIRYEEEYMMRLPLTKRQRHEARRSTTVSSLKNLAKFDDISALELGPDDAPKQKKRSSKKFSQKKGKRKSFKRKRFH